MSTDYTQENITEIKNVCALLAPNYGPSGASTITTVLTQLLRDHAQYGMRAGGMVLVKQGSVFAMMGNDWFDIEGGKILKSGVVLQPNDTFNLLPLTHSPQKNIGGGNKKTRGNKKKRRSTRKMR